MQMVSSDFDTIVAPATAPGRGGVGIVRVSGKNVQLIAQTILGFLPKPRLATYATFYGFDKQALDIGLALYFPAPHSFTGDDVIEFHGHGGPVVIDMLVNEIIRLGARLAKPGEFSQRAFLNDKIDLTQAEAIADLIDSASQQAARCALRSLQGVFAKQINMLVDALIRLRMYVEAAIDFPEEEIDFLSTNNVTTDLQSIIEKFDDILKETQQGVLLREGINIVIVGKPNAGKSSLLNQLSGRDSAIVTDIPGTTRDVLREYIQIDGIPLHVIDTAGLRESADIIEQEGIRRACSELEKADVVLLIVDEQSAQDKTSKRLRDELLAEHPQLVATLSSKVKLMLIRNKIDLSTKQAKYDNDENMPIVYLSAKTGDGVEHLRTQLKALVGENPHVNEGSFIARRRHLDAIERARELVVNGSQQLATHKAGELLAEDLRQAQYALNEITGEFSSDDLLGEIFSSFCIGK